MTITLTREEAQQVLDALINAKGYIFYNVLDDKGNRYDTAIEFLRARLSAPEPEPVAWMNESDIGKTDWKVWAHGKPTATMPLYAAPPQREWKYDPMTGEPLIDGWPLYSGLPKPWQGLTDEEIKSLLWETRVDNLTFARVIEKVLKEKNAA